jgi:hypothetical protein
MSVSANARHVRWEQLMAENKGKIDVGAAQRFLAIITIRFAQEIAPSERTLCGHIDLSARGSIPWQPRFGPAGTVQNKAADGTMIARMSFTAAMGHADGIDFKAAEHLKNHPDFTWDGIAPACTVRIRDLGSFHKFCIARSASLLSMQGPSGQG